MGGTEDVGIEKPHFVAVLCESHGEVGSHCRFTHSAFARRHTDDVFYTGEHFGRLGIAFLGLHSHVTGNFNPIAYVGGDGNFGLLDKRADKRVGWFLEDERERHFVAVDADVVLHHAVAHQVFTVTGIADSAQSIDDEGGI